MIFCRRLIKMNRVFVVSNNIERVDSFLKYYNIGRLDTDTDVSFILDDRNTKFNTSHIDEKIYYVSSMIESCRDFFNDKESFDLIIDIYGVAIKWLVFPYVHKVLGVKKAMMMDDDTFLLKPIDTYFNNDYVFKSEGPLGIISTGIGRMLSPLYDDLVKVQYWNMINRYEGTDPKFSLNSGQLIHTENDMYMEFLNRAFCKSIYITLAEAKLKYEKKWSGESFNRGYIGGRTWHVEQFVYAIYYKWLLNNDYDVAEFGKDVRLQPVAFKKKPNLRFDTLPKFIHYLPKDKSSLYDVYAKSINELMENR